MTKVQFAARLRNMMKTRGLTIKGLAEAAEVWPSQVVRYRRGDALPSPTTLARFATIMDWPGLVRDYDELLTGSCAYCSGRFQRKHHAPEYQRFCSDRCRNLWHIDIGKKRRRADTENTIRSLAGRLAGKETSHSDLQDTNNAILAAVASFCRSCEWDGLCKTPSCELREWSPLPLVASERRLA